MGGEAPDSANRMLMPHLDTHSAKSSSQGAARQYLSMSVMQFGEAVVDEQALTFS